MSCWVRRNLINFMKVHLWQITNNLSLFVNSALTAVHSVISLLVKSQFDAASVSVGLILAAEVSEYMVSTDLYGIQIMREHLIGDKSVKFYKYTTNTVTNTGPLSSPQTPLKKPYILQIFWIRNNCINFLKRCQPKSPSPFSFLKILQMLY